MRTEPDGTVTYFPLDQPGSEVSVAWYLEMPRNRGNLLAMVFRDGPDKPWKAVIRTRHYVDDKVNEESRDERSGCMIETSADKDPDIELQLIVERIDDVMTTMKTFGGELHRISGHTSMEHFFEIWRELPFNNMRIMQKTTVQ